MGAPKHVHRLASNTRFDALSNHLTQLASIKHAIDVWDLQRIQVLCSKPLSLVKTSPEATEASRRARRGAVASRRGVTATIQQHSRVATPCGFRCKRVLSSPDAWVALRVCAQAARQYR